MLSCIHPTPLASLATLPLQGRVGARGTHRECNEDFRHLIVLTTLDCIMATAIIDDIATRYEVMGSGPPLLMYAPAGFDATLEKWSTQGVYAKIKLLDHLPKHYTCIVFDRRECGQSGGRVEHLTWAHYVAQGKGLLEHLGFQRAHLMGGCMGCCPVAAFGVMHPQMVLS